MKDLMQAVNECVHRVGEMPLADLNAAVEILERGLIHALIEQRLRDHDGVSRLRAVTDTSH